MPALARGQENAPSIVNWFITVNGVLTDAYEVGFRILDITGGLPGTQIFPTTPGDYENVSSLPGKFSVGSYYAYDNGNAQGWTPGLAEPIGTHRIEWRWKISASAPYQADSEDFEVLAASAGSSADTYCSVQDIRDEGITSAMADDAKVLAYIEAWQAFIERACRQWFNARQVVFSVDGNDSDTLFFSVPIIQIDYLKINGNTVELDEDLFKVYSGRDFPDSRGNPHISLVGPDYYRDIYTAPLIDGRMKFRKGRQNQEIKGIFGYTEADGSTPKLIKRALMLLVVEKLTNPMYPDPASPITPSPSGAGSVLEEWTDGHKIKYGTRGGEVSERKPGLSGITTNVEILDILKLYKGPIGIGAPSHWSIR